MIGRFTKSRKAQLIESGQERCLIMTLGVYKQVSGKGDVMWS